MQSGAGWILGVGVTLLLGCSAELGSAGLDKGQGENSGDGPNASGEYRELILSTALVRRLTRDELRYSLEDTFSIKLSDEEMSDVPADRPLEGFVNVATSQTVLPDHAEAYAELAILIASKLKSEGRLLDDAPCGELKADCYEGSVRSLGMKLFRSELSQEEIDSFAGLFRAVAEGEQGSFELGMESILRAMLQSPQFIYRLEAETSEANGLSPGEDRRVSGREMASRLSYLLWASAPDEELLDAAVRGDLEDDEKLLAQIDRMLENKERSMRVTSRYITDWARLEALPDDGGLKSELIASLIASYNDQIWEQGVGPLDLLSADELWLTGRLAENYGLEKKSEDLAPYDISSLSGRAGMLTHPGLVAGMTNADGGAIVARGLFLQSQLFCQVTPNPPQAVLEAIEEFLETIPEDASNRFVAEKRLERNECGTCHSGFDPLAYGLEQFDYQGRFRETDEYGNSLNTDGWIPGRVRLQGDDLPYQDIESYAALLAEEPAVSRCLTAQHIKQAIGAVITEDTESAVPMVQSAFEEGGRDYPAMLRAIALNKVFHSMKVE